jgi:hypothetical protein
MMELPSTGAAKLNVYPESDGLPAADNTKQMRWIVVLFGNLAALYRERRDVLVAANLFWYPATKNTVWKNITCTIRTKTGCWFICGRATFCSGSAGCWGSSVHASGFALTCPDRNSCCIGRMANDF